MARCGNYCASKAALHHWILVLREQLRGSKVKVIELFPPAVQSMKVNSMQESALADFFQPNFTIRSISQISKTGNQ